MAEEEKEASAVKTSQTSEQAKVLLAKEAAGKAMRITEKFMVGVFKFGKVIAALFMLLSILVMIGSLIYWVFAGASSIKVPDYGTLKATAEAMESASDSSASNKEFSEVRAKYSSKVEELIVLCKLDADKDFTRIIKQLCSIDREYRSDYIRGAISFIKDAKSDSENKTFKANDMLSLYDAGFEDAIKDAKESKIASAVKRSMALEICGMALLTLILFLIVPLLIQIEENTRK